ncbi:MAG: Hsp20/alpha crystallin family protein [Alphaproteobacteria bacterium]|nr:Hsp20/alpha crystallin family protein [Alphaproteobacteria bacterium]
MKKYSITQFLFGSVEELDTPTQRKISNYDHIPNYVPGNTQVEKKPTTSDVPLFLKTNEDVLRAELPIDLKETEDAYILAAHIPGIQIPNIDITIHPRSVSISTNKQYSHNEKNSRFIYQEIYQGDYARTTLLASDIQVAKAEARYIDGVLTLVLPKLHNNNQPKKLQIKKI